MMKKKTNIDFMAKKKTFWMISLSIFAIGLICNIIFGTDLDIKFTGGAMFKYSYSDEIVSGSDGVISDSDMQFGAVLSNADVTASYSDIIADYSKSVNTEQVEAVVSKAVGREVKCGINTRLNVSDEDTDNKNLIISMSGNESISQNADTIIRTALSYKYPNITFTLKESNSVDPAMGSEFFWKCMVAVILAGAFMILYVALRFKKIGGWTAGATGVIAIVHDCLVVYFAFVICGFPIDDNFIAVVLAIIGYSLNSTIVIFDRIRENRKLLGPKVPVGEVANLSMNETLGRTINTNLCVFLAVGTVAVVSVVFGLDSIMRFAIPMMFGTLSGCYSSLCISNTLWVTWQEARDRKKLAAAAAAKGNTKNK